MHSSEKLLNPMSDAFTFLRLGVVCAAALLYSVGAQANPVDPQVISGQAAFNTVGRQLDIANTPGAIINWRGFSIGAGEVTRFLQQSVSSAVLNRVVGQDPSRILGALVSNGRVFLINPNGIVFGAGARIDTAGLVASTLNMSDKDFAAGRLRFTAGDSAGAIENAGVIKTARGGLVYLIAPQIRNSGLISSPQGNVVLAAGSSVELLDPESPNVRVAISAPGGHALNLGRIVAESGRIGIYAGLIDQRGIINADRAVRGASGQIILRSSGDIDLHDGSIVGASGGAAGDGGAIQIVAGGKLDLAEGARVSVDGGTAGGNGGSLDLSGKQLSLQGSYTGQAHVPGYHNGSLLLDPEFITIASGGTYSLATSGILDATASPGSSLTIDPSALANGGWSNIQLSATQDITVASPIASLGAANALSLNAGHNINLNAGLGSTSQPLAADVNLSAGTSIKFASSVYLTTKNTLALSGKTLIRGNQQITAGQLQAGQVNIAYGHTLAINAQGTIDGIQFDGGTLTLTGGSLVNVGTSNFSEGSKLVLAPGTRFTNAAGASFILSDDGTGDDNDAPFAISTDGNGSASFINLGTFKSDVNAHNATAVSVDFLNSGEVQNATGTLTFSGATTGAGTFNTASGATLEFSGKTNLESPANLVGGSVKFDAASPVTFSTSVSTQPGQGVLLPVSDNGVPLSVQQINQPLHGSVTENTDGSLSYAPAPGFTGTDNFSYQLTANDGGSALAYATVQVGNPQVVGATQIPNGLSDSLISQTNALSTNPGLPTGTQKEKRNAASSCN